MKRLKNIIGGIVVVLLVILVINISFNVFYINDFVDSIYETHYLIGEMKENYIEMDLPLRVLKNIASQESDTIDEDRLQNLVEANDRNAELLVKSIHDNQEILKKSKAMLHSYNKNIILNNFNLFDQSYNLIENLEIKFFELKVQSERLLDKKIVETGDLDRINKKYISTKPLIDDLIVTFDQNIIALMDLYIKINNMLMGIMVLTIFTLIFFLYRIGKTGLPYIMKAFTQMNNQNYELEQLPAFEAKFQEEALIQSMVHEVMLEQDYLQKIKIAAGQGYLLTEVIDDIFEMIEKELSVDRIAVAFVDYNNKKIIAEYGVANYEEIFLSPGFSVSFNETSLYELIKNPKTLVTNDLEKLYEEKSKESALSLVLREGVQSNIVFPLITDKSVFGFLFFSSVHKHQFDNKTKTTGENIAREIAGILDKTYLTKMIFSKITHAFADLVEKKDTETGEHLDRMVEYSRFIAQLLLNHSVKEYCVDNKFIREIVNNAPVHDIGKVSIPDKILKKPGKLNADEWEVMKTHAATGADIFSDLKKSLEIFNHDFYKVAENITRYHHEKWNGQGYPEGLKGSEIPLEARIVAVADVFDALTSKRVYKDEFSFEKAWTILEESSGEHFDPELINLLKNKKKEFRNFYLALHQSQKNL